ncbi:MAG: PP2C family protein-serine/threonine phosphatase [Nocardioidaceae bacterium]
MSLRQRLTGLFAVLLLLLGGAGTAVVVALRAVESNRTQVTSRLQPASLQSRALLTALVDQETGERGFVITGNVDFLAPYRNGREAFAANVADLQAAFAGDARLTRALQGVENAAAIWDRVAARPEIAARRTGDLAEAERLVRSGRGKSAFDNVRGRVSHLEVLLDAEVEKAQEASAAAAARLRDVVLATIVLLTALAVVTGVMMRQWALLPVLALRADMRAVAGGDLDRPVRDTGPAEVAAIGRDAESMRRRIVDELEASRAASEALTQHSPVVAGLRRELTSQPRLVTPGVTVAGRLQSAEGVLAGDWWEALTRPDGSTAVVVADVSGHGAEAGLVAYRFKHRLTALLASDLDLDTVFDLAAAADILEDERFLVCMLVVVDPGERRVRWVNAGHPPAQLVSPDGSVRELEPTGPMVSAVSLGWTSEEAPFEEGDLLVLSTDGILEARNADGAEFGEEGVREVLAGLRLRTPQEAVEEVCEAARRFAVDVRRDDVTCVAVALDPAADGGPVAG